MSSTHMHAVADIIARNLQHKSRLPEIPTFASCYGIGPNLIATLLTFLVLWVGAIAHDIGHLVFEPKCHTLDT